MKKKLTLNDIKVDRAIADFFESLELEEQDLRQTPYLLVSSISTGGMKFDKCVEIACRLSGDADITFSSLINPERDLTKAVNTGLDATQLSLAPRLNQVESFLRLLFDQKVIVTQSFSRLKIALPLPANMFEWGIGHSLIDNRDHQSSNNRAAQALEFNAQTLSQTKEHYGTYKPARNLSTTVSPGSYFVAVSQIRHEVLFNSLKIDQLDENSKAAVIAGSLFQDEIESQDRVKLLSRKFGVRVEFVKEAAKAVVANLISNATANGAVSVSERTRIENYASQFGIEVQIDTGGDRHIEMFPGMKVCLTGSPPNGNDFFHLTKPELRRVLLRNNLEELPSITKKCQLVIAFNKESLSGKAKKARELGIPVISSEEFLRITGDL